MVNVGVKYRAIRRPVDEMIEIGMDTVVTGVGQSHWGAVEGGPVPEGITD